MKFSYEEFDLSGVKTYPLASRKSKASAVDFAASLCHHQSNTIIAMHRTFEGGHIREQFRTLHSRENRAPTADRLHAHARAFEFFEVEEQPGDRIDLAGLAGAKR